MEKFKTLVSGVLPLDIDNVDTDMIIPAEHLKSVSRDGYGAGLFSVLKSLYPDFIFNNTKYNQGQILLSKNNFGCGSSREHAVWALQQYGIKVVVCSSFSDIFFNNAAKNGLLLISLPGDIINSWIAKSLKDHTLQMTVNLAEEKVIFDNQIVEFKYDQYRKHCLLNGLDDLTFLLSALDKIEAYENKR